LQQRDEAIGLHELIRGGGDPLEEKHKERATPTLADLFEGFTERHAAAKYHQV
jgi:hypothetical protein